MKTELILSISAIVVSITSLVTNVIFEIKNRKSRKIIFDFDVQKETTRQLEKRTDDIYTRLNSRSSLIPYFIISLEDSKIAYKKNGESTEIKLFITLENIGLNSAVDIEMQPYGDGMEDFIKSDNRFINTYYISEYLSCNHCISKDKINFVLIKKDLANNFNIVNDFISFKTSFKDLLGNTYCQEHRCGYGFVDDEFIFSMKNYSSVPDLIEENIKIE